MTLRPDELTMLELVRKSNMDTEITITKRDGKIVAVRVMDLHMKEFKEPVSRVREGVVL